jgi:crossover junction endodeoxyribonuclease RusA
MTTVWRISTGLTKPLSLNDRLGWHQKARQTRAIRSQTAWNARALRIPRQEFVTVRLEYVPRDKRRRDTDNLWATAKPAIDGLVDAGVIPDDTSEYVTRLEPAILPPDPAVTGARLWLVVAA